MVKHKYLHKISNDSWLRDELDRYSKSLKIEPKLYISTEGATFLPLLLTLYKIKQPMNIELSKSK